MSYWKRFETALTGVLAVLTDDQYLIVRTRAGNRFVQFAGQGCAGLRAEAASNRVLELNERLDPAALDRLDALGYNRPTHDLSEDDEHDTGSCNHYFDYDVPVPLATAADQAVRALTEVFRVRHPNELVYTAFADDGPPLLLPTLGLEVDQSAWPYSPARDRNLSVEELQRRVFEVLDGEFEYVEPFAEGTDLQVRFGPAVVFVRVVGDPPVVHVWSPVVNEITNDSPAFLQEVNQRNLGARFVRFASLDDTLIASHELFARPFVPAHLIYAVSLIGDLAESIDDEFCDRFGGHAFFPQWEDERDEP